MLSAQYLAVHVRTHEAYVLLKDVVETGAPTPVVLSLCLKQDLSRSAPREMSGQRHTSHVRQAMGEYPPFLSPVSLVRLVSSALTWASFFWISGRVMAVMIPTAITVRTYCPKMRRTCMRYMHEDGDGGNRHPPPATDEKQAAFATELWLFGQCTIRTFGLPEGLP